MSGKSKLTDKERIEAVQEYLDGKGGYRAIAQKYGIHHESFRSLVKRAESEGIDAVRYSAANNKYSSELKTTAVEAYLSGESRAEICAKYGIRSRSTLQKWILCYNSGKSFKERTRSERGITMNKGRKTTREERAEIVAFCIENGKDYAPAMEKYGVSYQQIYSWVRKYEAKGVDGLSDRRGKPKPEDELTEADRLRMENKILQAKLKDQEMELKLIKKLMELKGGGR